MSQLKFTGNVLPLTTAMLLVVCCAAVQADYSEAVLADGPIGYWRLNETTSDTASNLGTGEGDLDGLYFDGAQGEPGPDELADGTPLTGMGEDNLALEVGDVDQYVTVEDSILSGLTQFSMSGWVKLGLNTADRVGLFGQNDTLEFGLINPTQIQMWSPNGGALNYPFTPDDIEEDAWYHVATVGTGAQIQLYINGNQVATGGAVLPNGYGGSAFNFNIGGGGIYDATGNQFTGTLDEVAIWDVALTEAQVQGIYSEAVNAAGDFPQAVLDTGPLGYWRLNDADGDAAVNLGVSGAELNGTYNAGTRGVPGPAAPGLGAGNVAYQVGPDDSYVGVDASPLNFLEAFTVGGWVMYEELGDRIGLFGQNDAVEFGFIDLDTIQIWTPGGGAANYDFFDEIEPEEWFYLTAVGDGEELLIYVNGEVAQFGGTIIPEDVTPYGDSGFFFNIGGGGIYDDVGNQFTGVLSNVAVWDKALTAEQIKTHFDAAVGSTGLVGDYNNNGELDAGDLDLQAVEILADPGDPAFDLNGDNVVDFADRQVWINDLKITWMGDANLNCVFDSSDQVQKFVQGKYEQEVVAGWADGDSNGDMRFNSSDMVADFVSGGYEKVAKPGCGVDPAVNAVPEPGSIVLALLGMAGLVGLARRGRR